MTLIQFETIAWFGISVTGAGSTTVTCVFWGLAAVNGGVVFVEGSEGVLLQADELITTIIMTSLSRLIPQWFCMTVFTVDYYQK